ncbi:MAG TPA: serine hydrolase domain-containing protein [Gaiellaceae bacterium]
MTEIGERVRQAAEAEGFSGVVLVAQGGEPLLAESIGLANRAEGVAVEMETRFDVASAAKMFVGVAAARLVERGMLAYETPVAGLLPSELVPRDLSPEVTVHHLLTHTSGIADYADDDNYAEAWLDAPSYRMRRAADYAPLYVDLPRRFEPGGRFEYCGAGFILLGLAIEQSTGLTFAEAIRSEVFEPAGMSSSGYFALDEVHPRVAVGYVPGDPIRTNVFSIPVVGGPDGGAFCTAGDLDRFLRAFAAGNLVSDEARETVLTPHARDTDGWGYGYGFWLSPEDDEPLYGHSGEDPGGSARAWHLPGRDANVIVLSNLSAAAHVVDRMVQETMFG